VGIIVLWAHVALEETMVHAAVVDAPHPHHMQLAFCMLLASPRLLLGRQEPFVKIIFLAIRLVITPDQDQHRQMSNL